MSNIISCESCDKGVAMAKKAVTGKYVCNQCFPKENRPLNDGFRSGRSYVFRNMKTSKIYKCTGNDYRLEYNHKGGVYTADSKGMDPKDFIEIFVLEEYNNGNYHIGQMELFDYSLNTVDDLNILRLELNRELKTVSDSAKPRIKDLYNKIRLELRRRG